MKENKVLKFDNSWLDPDAPPPVESGDRLLRIKEITKMVGVCATTIYRHMRKGDFPQAIRLSDRVTLWSHNDVQKWIEKKKAEAGISKL